MSGACDVLVRDASAGVAASLRAVDCVSNEATAGAFTRLFGTHGALLPALTVLLTIYVGVFALMMLTGRARLSIGSLTPRMVMLGLVLTFTTSSVAYQGVVWNMAVGAPDQIAGVLLDAKGPATHLFADRIDILFNAIAETASNAVAPGAPRPTPGAGFSPATVMWLGAMMLMLGTVGVLVTARIALAVLLAVGPVFICMVLFKGTRGLFAGWIRGVAMMAMTPLFAVLGGALMIELAVPVAAALRGAEGIDARAAMALFVIAAVHCALMALALRVASAMVSGWTVFGLGSRPETSRAGVAAAPGVTMIGKGQAAAAIPPRLRSLVASVSPAASGGPIGPEAATSIRARSAIIPATASGAAARPSTRARARGVGSRFSSTASAVRVRSL